jgi:hypothetical protein
VVFLACDSLKQTIEEPLAATGLPARAGRFRSLYRSFQLEYFCRVERRCAVCRNDKYDWPSSTATHKSALRKPCLHRRQRDRYLGHHVGRRTPDAAHQPAASPAVLISMLSVASS